LYGVWAIIDSGLGGANFKDEDYSRRWHQREGTKTKERSVLNESAVTFYEYYTIVLLLISMGIA
jgi:hypothetical protein